ncbi:MAG: LacI family transcriptional regulator [Frankiales bacterium]|nr:LacI family transcriptional regulator [Frankiales bacterium]
MNGSGPVPRRRVTQADVARAAKVSRTTASFVLTGRTDMRISADVQRRVQRVAAALGYRPNLAATGLRMSRTHTFGLLSDTIATSPFAGELIHGSSDAALQHDRLLFVAESEGDSEVEARLFEAMIDRRVDGLVYATMFTREVTIPAHAADHPLVLLNCFVRSGSLPSVIPDERAAGHEAARTLLGAGHYDRVVLLGEPAPRVFAGRERVGGIKAELKSAGTRLAGNVRCTWSSHDAYDSLLRFLRENPAPTALICLNDRIALGAYQALSTVGLRVPEQVSVLSFDDSVIAPWLVPELTTIALPHYAMGHRAVELLATGALEPGAVRVPMPLRDRTSVAAPRERSDSSRAR